MRYWENLSRHQSRTHRSYPVNVPNRFPAAQLPTAPFHSSFGSVNRHCLAAFPFQFSISLVRFSRFVAFSISSSSVVDGVDPRACPFSIRKLPLWLHTIHTALCQCLDEWRGYSLEEAVSQSAGNWESFARRIPVERNALQLPNDTVRNDVDGFNLGFNDVLFDPRSTNGNRR